MEWWRLKFSLSRGDDSGGKNPSEFRNSVNTWLDYLIDRTLEVFSFCLRLHLSIDSRK
jgi:hypothetical protein